MTLNKIYITVKHNGCLKCLIHLTNNYIILDGFECDTRIYCSNYENTERVGDESNIVLIIIVKYRKILPTKS